MNNKISSPKEFYGFKLGSDRKIARWDQIVEYFWHLDGHSPCVKVTELGKSTMGHPFLLAIITSPQNLKNLDRIQEISLRLAHPKGLTERDVEKLLSEGKTIVSNTMSVHGSEIGGTQTASELAYELATSDDSEIQTIRENTVFLLIPCANPDGNILIADWYQKWLDTEYEGGRLPYLYHKYVGHDNNRDAFHVTQKESKLLTRFFFKDWYPQAQVDFHHMGSYGARFNIPPHTDPIFEHVDPLIWTEEQLYGSLMLVDLEAAGKTGVETKTTYPADGIPAWDETLSLHCTCGMLTESASAKLATPMYVHHQQLEPARRDRPEYRPQVVFPHPWPGGWWRLRDIVEQQKIASIAALKVAAHHRERILQNMFLKARRQSTLGTTEPPCAFIVSPRQHDPVTALKLLRKLHLADVTVHRAEEAFEVVGMPYPKGTYVIFTAQTCRPYILKLLKRTFYHDGPITRKEDGTPKAPYDLSTDTLAEFMGVDVKEVETPVTGEFKVCDEIPFPKGRVEASDRGHLLDGRLNESFKVVNSLLQDDVTVYRAVEPVGEFPKGSFYIPPQDANAEKLGKIAEDHPVVFQQVEAQKFEKIPIKPLKIAMYKRYWGGNVDEGWTRWLLEEYGFDYQTIKDDAINEGNLVEKFDAIIIPHDPPCLIRGDPKKIEEYFRKLWPKFVLPKYPSKFQSGIDEEGIKHLREFVEAGGRLITLGKASEFAIEVLDLPLRNPIEEVESKEFLCPGSTLKVSIDMDHSLSYGMDDDAFILFGHSSRKYPVFELLQSARNEDFDIVVKFPERRLLQSGWLIGESYLSKKAVLIEVKEGNGEVILYGFRPQFRAETAATFKLFFNALMG